MAFTQDQLDSLEEALASGALTVKYRDKEVTYRSLNEMLKLRDMIATKLGKKTPGAVAAST
jgi:thiamine monophosphate synthase